MLVVKVVEVRVYVVEGWEVIEWEGEDCSVVRDGLENGLGNGGKRV